MVEIYYRNPLGKTRRSDVGSIVLETGARVEWFWKIHPFLSQVLRDEGGKGNLVFTGSVAAGRAIVGSDIDIIDVIIPLINPIAEQESYCQMQQKIADELTETPYRLQFLPVTSLEKYQRLLRDQGTIFFE
ncbi:MAG: hypothetical protein UU93_C0006G0051 [Candidatus Amesbacteria bacterium GW2011_GWA2_42_12]|uniref:Uncharacterized protein n=1 Tax=Candidatus Amesbacteria bacterium GW2011_GWA2_42_12 TaxID=1618356 RepID=A0A0G0Y770_9BACT|nr:MAG: hypothetical protein UU93_C0006G0051 [Candidatus Amesbacteria bacterium GW2011_GWA2_42_12]